MLKNYEGLVEKIESVIIEKANGSYFSFYMTPAGDWYCCEEADKNAQPEAARNGIDTFLICIDTNAYSDGLSDEDLEEEISYQMELLTDRIDDMGIEIE